MADDNDARFLITNSVIPSLNRLDKNFERVFGKLEESANDRRDLRITDEVIKAKIASVEMMNIRTQEDVHALTLIMDKHRDDLEKHYNPTYNETLPQKLWRKKPEIAAGGGLGALIATIIILLIEHFLV